MAMLNVPEVLSSLEVLPPFSRLPSPESDETASRETDKTASFGSDYKITDKVLGSGLNGQVKLAVHRQTGKKVAVKSYKKRVMTQRQRNDLNREVHAQTSLQHPNVARIEAVYESEEHVRLLVESLEGGEVFTHMMEAEDFDEQHATLVMTQLLLAVGHMHQVGLVHRDIKPENMMYTSSDRDMVKLIDFGFCTHWEEGDKPMTRRCGTEGYMAPEVMRKDVGYTSAADMWSVGVVAHVLLSGEIIGRNSDWTPVFSGRMSSCSIEAQKFVAALLQADPEARMTADQALRHSWLNSSARQERIDSVACSTVADSLDLHLLECSSHKDLDFMICATSVKKWKQDFAGIFPNNEPEVPTLREKKSLWNALPSIMPSMKLGKVRAMVAAIRNCKSKRASRVSVEI